MNAREVKYSAKQRYVDKRNAESAKIGQENGLSEEQTDTLEKISKYRHRLHSNMDELWNAESNADDLMDFIENISSWIDEAGLPNIDAKLDLYELPNEDVYYYVLSDEEREEWEEKANKFNEENPCGMKHSGYSLWMNESEEYLEFVSELNRFNDEVESYLKGIDEKHGTSYAPTGFARLYSGE